MASSTCPSCSRANPSAAQPSAKPHVHHADGPPVAVLAAVERDVLGELRGLLVATLVVANEREQAVGPAEPAPVAELGERGSRVLQPFFRGLDVAAREGDPR